MKDTAASMLSDGLTVRDETVERSDLAQRREVKYALLGADIGKVRSHLSGNCRRLVHNQRVSAVKSIYFDDLRLSACHANLDGVAERRKLRLRWYDTDLPNQTAWLEVKWRSGEVTGKHRLQIQSPVPLHEFKYTELIRKLSDAVPERIASMFVKSPEPVVVVQYDREHFSSTDGKVRITLDYNLRFCDQVGRTNICTKYPVPLHDLFVIEGKIPVGYDRELRQTLAPFIPRANRFSKYVHGCRLLGHIDENDEAVPC